jgi:ADP-ribose pyrophosphatase
VKKPMELEKHHIVSSEDVFECRIFKARSNQVRHCLTGAETMMYTLEFSDWVNIIPVTASGHVVLVKQHRVGTDSITWETPGGAVSSGEKDLTMAALRELEEETGLSTKKILALPGMSPNPAIQGNRITYFLALDVQPVVNRMHHPDAFEHIELEVLPFAEAVDWARTGRINHALAALGLLLAEPYIKTAIGSASAVP